VALLLVLWQASVSQRQLCGRSFPRIARRCPLIISLPSSQAREQSCCPPADIERDASSRSNSILHLRKAVACIGRVYNGKGDIIADPQYLTLDFAIIKRKRLQHFMKCSVPIRRFNVSRTKLRDLYENHPGPQRRFFIRSYQGFHYKRGYKKAWGISSANTIHLRWLFSKNETHPPHCATHGVSNACMKMNNCWLPSQRIDLILV
jgi:hypothetical protein